MPYLEDLDEMSVQTFIMFSKVDGFSEVDIEGALATKVQNLNATFSHLNLYFDDDTHEITARDNETLALTSIPF